MGSSFGACLNDSEKLRSPMACERSGYAVGKYERNYSNDTSRQDRKDDYSHH